MESILDSGFAKNYGVAIYMNKYDFIENGFFGIRK
jgi:hypothetical protein